MAIDILEYRGNSIPLSGRHLAHNRSPLVERAYSAADLVSGAAHLITPTIVQAAWLCRINKTYVGWALKRPGDRAAILADDVPLVPPRTKPANTAEAIVLKAIKEIGADRVLDLACAAETYAVIANGGGQLAEAVS